MPLLFLLFFGVPLLEVYLLIQVGSKVGALTTVLLVVFTAALGAIFIRIQGVSTISQLQQQLAAGQMPGQAILDAGSLVLAGLLLLTPGFFTDSIGFLLLVPALRRSVFKRVLKRFFVPVKPKQPGQSGQTVRVIQVNRTNDE